MRPKVVVPALLVALGSAFWLLLLARHGTEPTRASAPVPTLAAAPDPPGAATVPASASAEVEPRRALAQDATDPSSLEASTPQSYAEQRIDELRQLGMTGDPNSLTTILSELTNRDPSIRRAAVDAAVQFGSRDAVPALQDAWSQTDVPEEKIALQNAIAFLQLPAMGELHRASSGAQ